MEIADNVEYLSIGEVLGELKAEFDEVSISKIRFLEAQGLIEPERTKSGYRRFYTGDVARLRWILRQQRDHFLPLKVIKARLDEVGDIDFEAAIAVQPNLWSGTDDDPNRTLREAEAAAEALAHAQAQAEPAALADAWDAAGGPDDDPVNEPRRARQRKRKRKAPAVISDAAPIDPVVKSSAAQAPANDEAEPNAISVSQPGGAQPEGAQPVDGEPVVGEPVAEEAVAGQAVAAGTPNAQSSQRDSAAWLASLQEAPADSRASRRSERSVEQSDPSPHLVARGLTFGRGEVLEVAGIDEAQLDSMEEYGLVVPTVIGGEPTYDASSLAVVKSVAVFLSHGVEPRHLRMFKNAADREAGFYEQMVLPLLKQRNPRASEQAMRTLSSLAGAGDELRRSLVQQALRSHFGD